jgi:hypothetical protein
MIGYPFAAACAAEIAEIEELLYWWAELRPRFIEALLRGEDPAALIDPVKAEPMLAYAREYRPLLDRHISTELLDQLDIFIAMRH